MDSEMIRAKFGDDYEASDNIYTMGIDRRFSQYIAGRFKNRMVLESCTGGGFTTISLAREARHVFTYEIDPSNQRTAMRNVDTAGLSEKVTFILGNVLDSRTVDRSVGFDAAFLDPDWAVTGENHVYRFRESNTRPPADLLLDTISGITRNIALVLPPGIDVSELDGLPPNELQRLYMNDTHELFCVYFGDLIRTRGVTECRV